MPAADCVAATAAALQVLAGADAVMGFRNQCGLSRTTQLRCQYTDDGRLWETNKYGVYEVLAHEFLLYLILLPMCWERKGGGGGGARPHASGRGHLQAMGRVGGEGGGDAPLAKSELAPSRIQLLFTNFACNLM